MITKEDAKKLGVQVVDGGAALDGGKQSLMEKVKALLPNVVNADNQLNTQALADLFDVTNTTSNNQGYELTFAGKGLARAKADQDTAKELKYIPAQSKATGEHQGTENVIIRGDNIDALKILYKNYHNAVKMIYIDPPYNTQSENFIYNDNFKASEAKLIEEFGLGEDTTNFLDNVYGTRSHSGWLAFMYPRLKLARELLRDDGVIFISIDDNEQANLKVMCDEIFGEDNFIGAIIWSKKRKGSFLSKNFVSLTEYILVYSKKSTDLKLFGGSADSTESQPLVKRTNSIGLLCFPKGIIQTKLKDGFYAPGIYGTGTSSVELKKPINVKNGIVEDEFVIEGPFIWSQKYLDEQIAAGCSVIVNTDSLQVRVFKTADNNVAKGFPSLIIGKDDSATNEDAYETLNAILGVEGVMSYPKPVNLIKKFITASSYWTNEAIILDFFAGSGTTAQAVMQQNAEDNGNRKFILVQWDEAINIEKNKAAYDFCLNNKVEPVISSIAIERVNRAGAKIKSENPDSKVDIGYKVYGLTDKPAIYTHKDSKQLELSNGRTSSMDTLINMLVNTCKPLHTPIKELVKDKLYEADGELYVIGNVKPEDLKGHAEKKINIDPFANFQLEEYLNLDIANRENVTVVY